MNIVVIDGQGGKLGRKLVEQIKQRFPSHTCIAVGANSIATAAMMKGGADFGATGENPVIVNARNADVIIGPLGIIAADALHGEITPAMACAVAQSPAPKLLIPVNRCNNIVIGVKEQALGDYVEEAIARLETLLA